jgi:hypothetical protein
VRVIIEVAGYRTGPIAAEQLARVAEASGAWGLYFESGDVGPESFTLHAAVASTVDLFVGAWLGTDNPFVAAEQLSVLDAVSGGRATGLCRDDGFAAEVEEILAGAEVRAGDDGLGGRTATIRLAPPPRQAALPVLRIGEGSVSHPRLRDLVRLSLPAEELLVPGIPLEQLVRSARMGGWQGPEIDAVQALGAHQRS